MSRPYRKATLQGYYNYQFVKGRKGPLKLLHQGYEYISPVQSDRIESLRLWRCCRYMYHQQVCGASAVLEASGKLSLLGVHNHLPAKLLHNGYEYLFEEIDKTNQRKLYRCHRYLSPGIACMAKAVVTEKEFRDYSFYRTLRGGARLSHRGYIFHLANRLGVLKYWQCENYQRLPPARCFARAVLGSHGGLSLRGKHNHPPSTLRLDGRVGDYVLDALPKILSQGPLRLSDSDSSNPNGGPLL
ncbi:hypothetical protein RUM44_009511 [Polyplax serrata]|uniref:FLYWCH-type domain-containing protein n=1 Tax=Polyplax serrata TaxID=468196 RepID=A0ABR1ASX7_POLSC